MFAPNPSLRSTNYRHVEWINYIEDSRLWRWRRLSEGEERRGRERGKGEVFQEFVFSGVCLSGVCLSGVCHGAKDCTDAKFYSTQDCNDAKFFYPQDCHDAKFCSPQDCMMQKFLQSLQWCKILLSTRLQWCKMFLSTRLQWCKIVTLIKDKGLKNPLFLNLLPESKCCKMTKAFRKYYFKICEFWNLRSLVSKQSEINFKH